MKKTILITTILMAGQLIFAGCGGCSTSKPHNYQMKKAGLLESVPASSYISGNVLVSCGMCNFMTEDNDCSLAIKVGANTYKVNGVGIDEHGDSHAKDGYCNVIKKAYVEGKIKNNKFMPSKMDLAKI